jgi:TATA-binding protein-associated factor Taf7
MNNRNGYKWSVNEVLSLQREFELLGMSIDLIAERHGRTANAIMYKLDQEKFADYNVLYSNYYNLKLSESKSKMKQIIQEEKEEKEEKEDKEDDDDDTYIDEEEEDESDPECDTERDILVERISNLESELGKMKNMLKALTSTSYFVSSC